MKKLRQKQTKSFFKVLRKIKIEKKYNNQL